MGRPMGGETGPLFARALRQNERVRFFTADLHFGHENIIRYCDRPFRSVAEMNAGLVDRWNATVSDSDEVWILGDVAMGHIDESLEWVRGLHGHKVLVTGNHDRCWAGRQRAPDMWLERYRSVGFDEIRHGTVSIELDGSEVLAGHFPYEGDSHDEDRFVRWRPVDTGSWLLHGHVHTRWQVNGRQINVGVDVWDYTPVAQTTLTGIIASGP